MIVAPAVLTIPWFAAAIKSLLAVEAAKKADKYLPMELVY
jgi:hypothetical protein